MVEHPKHSLKGYEVLLCVTGGIAAYKSADLASKLTQAGAGVSVAMTEAGRQFVAPLTFQTVTGRCVYTSLWQSVASYNVKHVSLTDLADLMVIAPATADMLAKMTHGLADDLVSTLALAVWGKCDILVAPAMNSMMWAAPATVANMATLRDRGVHVVGPDQGRLACGDEGVGRMSEPDEILTVIGKLLKRQEPKNQDL